jgi:hypothetical protein
VQGILLGCKKARRRLQVMFLWQNPDLLEWVEEEEDEDGLEPG